MRRTKKSVRFDPNRDSNIPAELHSDSDSDAGTDTECRQNTLLNTLTVEEGVEQFPPSVSRETSSVHAAALGNMIGSESLAGGLVPSAREEEYQDNDPINDRYKQRISDLMSIADSSHSETSSKTEAPSDQFSAAVSEKLKQLASEQGNLDQELDEEKGIVNELHKKSEATVTTESEPSRFRRFSIRRRGSIQSIKSNCSTQSVSNEDRAKEHADDLIKEHTTSWKPKLPEVSIAHTAPDDNAANEHNPSNRDYLEIGTNVPELAAGDEDAHFEGKPKAGVLGSLLKLYNETTKSASTPSRGPTPAHTPTASTPNALSPTPSASNGYFNSHQPTKSKHSPLLSPSISKTFDKAQKAGKKLVRPPFTRSRSSGETLGHKSGLANLAINSLNAATHPLDNKEYLDAKERKQKKKNLEAQRRQVAIEIADLLQRQRFLLRFGRVLMLYGAPSHRLEEFLYQCARTFEIDAQFLYVPGCVIVTFGDSTTHTSETLLLRVTQGLNLHKLHQAYLIYKDVVHGLAQVEAASQRIDDLLLSKNQYPTWLLVIFFGLASGFIGLFSFGGGWKELPIIFILSSIVGILQMYVAPRSSLYNNVFEISSCIFVSFFARAISSISHNGQRVFCFGAIVQSSIALILPGYAILTGSLELQAKSMVSGSVRMFYAIIYSMFLTFGITLGSAVYGWMDSNASSDLTCPGIPDPKWKILFVPISSLCLAVVNHAGYRELPIMVLVACAGYTVLALLQYNISNASIFTSTLGALTIGILGNLWSRLGHGLAFTTMVPGVLVIVPGGVAAQGSLIQGVALANSIVNKTHTAGSVTYDANSISNLGGTMTQVAVGISVGLFLSTLCVYPLGMKSKTTGFFTF